MPHLLKHFLATLYIAGHLGEVKSMTDDPLEGALHRSTNGHHRNDRARRTRARAGGGAECKVVCDFLTLLTDVHVNKSRKDGGMKVVC